MYRSEPQWTNINKNNNHNDDKFTSEYHNGFCGASPALREAHLYKGSYSSL